MPNLSDHLSSAATTAQLSARFAYAAAMKSINNLLLLGDGESWARQKVDFGGLPEMVRTFLQVAAGAADIPVTRLLGQSPAGLSATGDSDTRNYYDMISARQELDLRPQLERLDRLILRSAGVDPAALTFEFRPLWQMDAASKATVALNKAQATQIYAGLKLWPDAVTGRLVQAQLSEDGTYPGAEAIFAGTGPANAPMPGSGEAHPHDALRPATDFDPNQPRDPQGRWSAGGGASFPSGEVPAAQRPGGAPKARPSSEPGGILGLLGMLSPIGTASAEEVDPEEENRGLGEESLDPTAEVRIERYANARSALKAIDPNNQQLFTLTRPDYVPSEADVQRVEAAARTAAITRVCDFLRPDGHPIGRPGSSSTIRLMPGGLSAAQRDYDYLSAGGIPVPFDKGSMIGLPGNGGSVMLRPVSTSTGAPAIDISIPGVIRRKLHY